MVSGLTTDDGIRIFEKDDKFFILLTKDFENERLGDVKTIYTSIDDYLLKLRCIVVHVAFVAGNGEVEILYLICRRGNRVIHG